MHIMRRNCPYLKTPKENIMLKNNISETLRTLHDLKGGERFDTSPNFVFTEVINQKYVLNKSLNYRVSKNNKGETIIIISENIVSFLLDIKQYEGNQIVTVQTNRNLLKDKIAKIGLCNADYPEYVYKYFDEMIITNIEKKENIYLIKTKAPKFINNNQYSFFLIDDENNAQRLFYLEKNTSEKISQNKYGEGIYRYELEKKIKIGVWGSCYSRAAFSSNGYFNPNYKKRYVVNYTQFHCSINSIFNKKKSNYDYIEFNKLNQHFITYIKRDFEKNFFTNEMDIDYFIIDLWQDIHRGFLICEDETIISNSLFYSYHTNYLKKNRDKYRVVKPTANFEEFVMYFKKSVKIFLEELLSIVSEEKIIINRIVYSTEYFDENHNKKTFENIEFAKRINVIGRYLEDILIKEVPKCKIIDTYRTEYISDSQYPGKLSGNHYESKYYKEFMKNIDLITK